MIARRILPILLSLAALAKPAAAEDALSRVLEGIYVPAGGNTGTARVAPPTAARPTAPVVSEAEIIARVESELSKQWSPDGELRISFSRGWQPIRVPSDEWTVSIPELPVGGLSKSFLLRVRIMAQDRAWFDQQIVVQAQLWKPVLVAARRIDRGQPLDRGAAQSQLLDVLRDRNAPVPAETKLEDYEAIQGITEGRPITWKDICQVPLVKKGAVVAVVAGEGGLTINMKGVAMGTGGNGDAITVRNMDTRKDFQARVVNKNTVRVSF